MKLFLSAVGWWLAGFEYTMQGSSLVHWKFWKMQVCFMDVNYVSNDSKMVRKCCFNQSKVLVLCSFLDSIFNLVKMPRKSVLCLSEIGGFLCYVGCNWFRDRKNDGVDVVSMQGQAWFFEVS